MTPFNRITKFAMVILLFALLSSLARAQQGIPNLDSKISVALSRVEFYGDVVAMGGASIGSPYSSSSNPAALAWLAESSGSRYLNPQYYQTQFDDGLDLDVYALSVGDFKFMKGIVSPFYVQAEANSGGQFGLDFNFTVHSLPISYAQRINNRWAVGSSLVLTQSESDIRLNGLSVQQSESQGTDIDVTLGALMQASDRWLLGAVLQTGSATNRTTQLDPLTFQTVATNLKNSNHGIRLGLSYDLKEYRRIYADLSHYNFDVNNTKESVTRLHLGLQWPVHQYWILRVGANRDDQRDVVTTAGLGFYPNDQFGLELAYQHNPFPELESIFGDSETWGISGYWTFK